MSREIINKVKNVMLNGHVRALNEMKYDSEQATRILDWVENRVIEILKESEVDADA